MLLPGGDVVSSVFQKRSEQPALQNRSLPIRQILSPDEKETGAARPCPIKKMSRSNSNSFDSRASLKVGNRTYEIHRLDALADRFEINRLPYTHKILLENLLRCEDGAIVTADQIEALASWDPKAEPRREIFFRPSRILLQDYTGVPALVDLAAMREAAQRMGGNPERINPVQPVELVIDHSLQVDAASRFGVAEYNADMDAARNHERYAFLRWCQQAFANIKVVPPSKGIVHQVNLEHLARVVFAENDGRTARAYPDTVVGADSHTTMINGLGVLGWGVGGIEAESAMLGQPLSMLIPQVIGFRLNGRLGPGAAATDLVLTVTEMLRAKGVVGQFVEFFGDGLDHLPLADRATISNMSPEFGATCSVFPIDAETLRYLEFTGRDRSQVVLVEAYAREQGLFRKLGSPNDVEYSETIELDLGDVEPCLAGPKHPHVRIPLHRARALFEIDLEQALTESPVSSARSARINLDGAELELNNGAVVIAAITSCTNTSNPAVMVGAGLLARKACEKGLAVRPWVKTSLAPGSRVVTDYLADAGVLPDLEALGFHVVGYGCTTCIGNSGPLPEPIVKAIVDKGLNVCSVLSGNRNSEGRIHPDVRMNYLASPPLVVAYALAGRMNIDFATEPVGEDADGRPVLLDEIWPSEEEISLVMTDTIHTGLFEKGYRDVFSGDESWNSLEVPDGRLFAWDQDSTYIRYPPYFRTMGREPDAVGDIRNARVLALLGDGVTTDHIAPAGMIMAPSPAGRYLVKRGIEPRDFNSYGARRGNHEVMMRGTFASGRLRNLLVPGTEGCWTPLQPTGEVIFIYDAAMQYAYDRTPLIVIAGKDYGFGSSLDWAAKGPRLLGVKAVIAESFERIHRSNLVGMGILPLKFPAGASAASLGLTGREIYQITGVADFSGTVDVTAAPEDGGEPIRFGASVCIETEREKDYYRHGGNLHYVLRQLLGRP